MDISSPTSGVPARIASIDPGSQGNPFQLVAGQSPACNDLKDQHKILQKRLRVVDLVMSSLKTAQIQSTICLVGPLAKRLPQFQIWLDLAQDLPMPVIGVPSPCRNIGMYLVFQLVWRIIHLQPLHYQIAFSKLQTGAHMYVGKDYGFVGRFVGRFVHGKGREGLWEGLWEGNGFVGVWVFFHM